ncbi:hypothetical protein [Sorangium sp. So ce1000]|uniref:hypothetical protein n=1 Tax=Sorangium sp. So ce1000 TaxID=3133325 RepID=UPI003F5F7AF4
MGLTGGACVAAAGDEAGEEDETTLSGESDVGASSEPPSAAARSDIDAYVRSLSYDPRQLLSVQEDGATEAQPVKERKSTGNAVIVTTKLWCEWIRPPETHGPTCRAP